MAVWAQVLLRDEMAPGPSPRADILQRKTRSEVLPPCYIMSSFYSFSHLKVLTESLSWARHHSKNTAVNKTEENACYTGMSFWKGAMY